MRWRRFSFCISVKRLFLKAFSNGAINWGKDVFLDITKLALCFRTEYCASDMSVLEGLMTAFWLTIGRSSGGMEYCDWRRLENLDFSLKQCFLEKFSAWSHEFHSIDMKLGRLTANFRCRSYSPVSILEMARRVSLITARRMMKWNLWGFVDKERTRNIAS